MYILQGFRPIALREIEALQKAVERQRVDVRLI